MLYSMSMKSVNPQLSRFFGACVKVALVVACLAVAGTVYQTLGARQDLARHPAPGQRIDVGGYQLHLYCLGQGDPTVILIHGLGGNSYHWALVQPALAATTRVCAYDRAGYAWSDPGPRPRSPLQNAHELQTLLTAAGITGPLILVGHSWGTHGAQVYAELYPESVRGLVLVDGGIAAEALPLCPVPGCMPQAARVGTDVFLSLQPALVRLGVLRLFNFPQPYGDNLKYLSPEQSAAFTAGYGQTKGADTNLAEWQDWDTQVGQVGTPGSLGQIPIRVLMAETTFPAWAYGGESEAWQAYDQAFIAALGRLSADSVVTTIPGADHASPLFHPDHRQYVVDAVLELVGRVRQAR